MQGQEGGERGLREEACLSHFFSLRSASTAAAPGDCYAPREQARWTGPHRGPCLHRSQPPVLFRPEWAWSEPGLGSADKVIDPYPCLWWLCSRGRESKDPHTCPQVQAGSINEWSELHVRREEWATSYSKIKSQNPESKSEKWRQGTFAGLFWGMRWQSQRRKGLPACHSVLRTVSQWEIGLSGARLSPWRTVEGRVKAAGDSHDRRWSCGLGL